MSHNSFLRHLFTGFGGKTDKAEFGRKLGTAEIRTVHLAVAGATVAGAATTSHSAGSGCARIDGALAQDVLDLHLNLVLPPVDGQQMLERQQLGNEQSRTMCEACEDEPPGPQPATWRCDEGSCSWSLCDQCNKDEHMSSKTRKHTRTAIDQHQHQNQHQHRAAAAAAVAASSHGGDADALSPPVLPPRSNSMGSPVAEDMLYVEIDLPALPSDAFNGYEVPAFAAAAAPAASSSGGNHGGEEDDIYEELPLPAPPIAPKPKPKQAPSSLVQTPAASTILVPAPSPFAHEDFEVPPNDVYAILNEDEYEVPKSPELIAGLKLAIAERRRASCDKTDFHDDVDVDLDADDDDDESAGGGGVGGKDDGGGSGGVDAARPGMLEELGIIGLENPTTAATTTTEPHGGREEGDQDNPFGDGDREEDQDNPFGDGDSDNSEDGDIDAAFAAAYETEVANTDALLAAAEANAHANAAAASLALRRAQQEEEHVVAAMKQAVVDDMRATLQEKQSQAAARVAAARLDEEAATLLVQQAAETKAQRAAMKATRRKKREMRLLLAVR